MKECVPSILQTDRFEKYSKVTNDAREEFHFRYALLQNHAGDAGNFLPPDRLSRAVKTWNRTAHKVWLFPIPPVNLAVRVSWIIRDPNQLLPMLTRHQNSPDHG
jgi:hypothetical protein